MPRKARKYLETSFFHVMVQGIGKEYIFKEERYINRYLNIIKEKIKDSNIKIIAFCIMNNHAHLLINTENINELSNFMQKVNSVYARYYNYMENERVGYVFRDRYKSEPITDGGYLIQCVKYIHENPVKAGIVKKPYEYKYSSYNYFCKHKENHSLFSKDEMNYICDETILCKAEFFDVDIDIEKKINLEIEKFVNKENIKMFEIFEKSDILKELIRFLKQNNIKYTEIMAKFDITKGTMERLKR